MHYAITLCNLIPYAVYFAVRLCIKRTWLNNRDQFTEPKKGWRRDVEFQNDCLAFCLLHHKNLICNKEGVNHWIPYTEGEVGAKEKFQSHFMTDFKLPTKVIKRLDAIRRSFFWAAEETCSGAKCLTITKNLIHRTCSSAC